VKPARVYRWVEHTAELELELEAVTEREVLADALSAIGELLEDEEQSPGCNAAPAPLERRALHAGAALAPLERRALQAGARDRPALLAAWLEELLFLAESEGFIPLQIADLSIDADCLRATVVGRMGAPRPLVKAVTHHRLEFEPTDGGYRARVVFDV